MPPDFVVKNGLNRCSAASGARPAAVVRHDDLDLAVRQLARAEQRPRAASRAPRTSRRSRCARGSARPAAAGSDRRRRSAGLARASMRSRTLCRRASVSASVRRSSSSRLQSTGSRLTSRFLTKLRSRRMTSPARSACALICSSASTTSASSRSGELHEALAGLRIRRDGRQRLVDLVGEARGHLAHGREPAEMREALLQLPGLVFGLAAVGHVVDRAHVLERGAVRIARELRDVVQVPRRAVLQQDAVLDVERAPASRARESASSSFSRSAGCTQRSSRRQRQRVLVGAPMPRMRHSCGE